MRTLAAKDGGDSASAVLTGYVVINSDNLDKAARLAGGCPGLQYGVSVEAAHVVSPDRLRFRIAVRGLPGSAPALH